MGTRKLEDETVVIIGDEAENLPQKQDSLEHQAADEWMSTQDDGEVELSVYSQQPGQRGLSFMFTFFPSDYTKESLQQHLKAKYGGGSYRVQGRAGGKLKLNMPIAIADEPKETVNTNEIGELKSLLSGKGNNDTMQMMTLMMQMQSESAQRQSEMMQAGQQQMMQLLTVLLPAMTQKPEPTAALDPLAMLSGLKALIPEQPNQMDSVFQGIKLVNDLTGGGSDKETNDSDVIMEIAKTFGPAIVEKVTQAEKATTPAAAPIVQPTIEDMKRKQQAMFLENINRLLLFAKQDTDVNSVFDMLSAMLNDEQWLHLEQFLNMDDWFQKLSLIQPEVAQYDQWFVRLRSAVFDDPEDESDDTDLLAGENNAITVEDMDISPGKDEVESDATAGTPHKISDSP